MGLWRYNIKQTVRQCVCVCVSWPGHVVCHNPPAPPAALSEKPGSPCHPRHVGASLWAPGFGAPGWWDASALPALHWGPPSCNCVNKQKAQVTPVKEERLFCRHTNSPLVSLDCSTHSGVQTRTCWQTCTHSWSCTVFNHLSYHCAPEQIYSWISETTSNIGISIESSAAVIYKTNYDRSLTGNKRPWKSRYNDYGEESYSYISGWATRLQLYIHFGADLVIVKAPAVNLSYL